MAAFSEKNVYQMFDAADRKLGSWITRTTWSGEIARVIHVGELKGPPPYYGNPKVKADLYDASSGTLIARGIEITAPGTYKTWRSAPMPPWWRTPEEANADPAHELGRKRVHRAHRTDASAWTGPLKPGPRGALGSGGVAAPCRGWRRSRDSMARFA